MTCPTIDIHIHGATAEQLHAINRKLDTIMATQAETATTIAALTAQVTKIQAETDSILAKIATLTQQLADAIAAAGQTDPAVTTALTALQSAVQVEDDKVPDLSPAP